MLLYLCFVMNYAIPSDVVRLVYKELHTYLTSQLINEYRSAYSFGMPYCGCSHKRQGFMFNYRDLNRGYLSDGGYLFFYKYKNQTTFKLPKRYLYSTVKEIDCIEIN